MIAINISGSMRLLSPHIAVPLETQTRPIHEKKETHKQPCDSTTLKPKDREIVAVVIIYQGILISWS